VPARSPVATATVALGLVAASCASSAAGPGRTPAGGGLSGPLTVFAAASLADAFRAEGRALSGAHPRLRLTFSFAGSPSLVAQIRDGAPADVVATADELTMRPLREKALVSAPQVFARNRLVMVVAPGNPERIGALADLARPGLRVVLEAPEVPAGRYSRQALERAHVVVRPRSLELDVRAAVNKVATGDADATIGYVTDVRDVRGVAGVPIADEDNVVTRYLVAEVREGRHRAAARAYVEELLHGVGQRVLRDRGFLAP
jgi:molybdate transport system substrate-binding protein